MKIKYINWDGKEKTWDPENETRHYLLIDAYAPANHLNDDSLLSLHSGCVGCYGSTLEECEKETAQIEARWPGRYNLKAVNARIVKAPCAFDARENGIIVRTL